jgi:hypothetical protein
MRKILILLSFGTLFLVVIFRGSRDGASPEKNANQAKHEAPQLRSESHAQYEIHNVEKKLAEESLRIAQIDEKPNETEQRLRVWAESLTTEDLRDLATHARNSRENQDRRFLATLLMGWSQKAAALEFLVDLAKSSLDPLTGPQRFGDFERVLRMQAVDGILELPMAPTQVMNALQAILNHSDQAAVVDRAQRALWFLQGMAPTPTQQDLRALKELIQSPSE